MELWSCPALYLYALRPRGGLNIKPCSCWKSSRFREQCNFCMITETVNRSLSQLPAGGRRVFTRKVRKKHSLVCGCCRFGQQVSFASGWNVTRSGQDVHIVAGADAPSFCFPRTFILSMFRRRFPLSVLIAFAWSTVCMCMVDGHFPHTPPAVLAKELCRKLRSHDLHIRRRAPCSPIPEKAAQFAKFEAGRSDKILRGKPVAPESGFHVKRKRVRARVELAVKNLQRSRPVRGLDWTPRFFFKIVGNVGLHPFSAGALPPPCVGGDAER